MIVIPMAGQSRRFTEAGYDRPKYMLDLHGRPLFDWSALSFRSRFPDEPFLFIARDVQGTAAFLRSRIEALGISRSDVVLLDAPTAGQADTVALGLDKGRVDAGEPLTIFNIDTIRPSYVEPAEVADAGGWLEVFRGEGEGWSFVEADPAVPGGVVRTTEKVRISDLCCTGLYGFRSRALFDRALAMERRTPSTSELYVAPIYNHLIAEGETIRYAEIAPNQVVFSGVPDEYEALKRDGSTLAGMAHP